MSDDVTREHGHCHVFIDDSMSASTALGHVRAALDLENALER